MAAPDGPTLSRRDAEERAQEMGRGHRRGAGLAGGARRHRSQTVCRPRWRRDVRAHPLRGTPREGARDARAVCAPDRGRADAAGGAPAAGAPPPRRAALGAPARALARTESASRRPLRDRLRPRPDAPPRRTAGVDRAAGVGRLGALERRLLRAAHERARLESRRAVAHVHPTDGRRSGVPNPEKRTRDSPGVAPAGRSRAGPYPRLLPRLRVVEDARAVAAPRRPRTKPAHDLRRVTPYSEHGHCPAGRGWS